MRGTKQEATADIRTYLEEDTFCKYLRDIDQRYLVGIGTDGLRWTLWLKDLETGETKSGVPKVDLTSIIEQETIRLDRIDGKVADGQNAERNLLLDEFVPAFAVDNLPHASATDLKQAVLTKPAGFTGNTFETDISGIRVTGDARFIERFASLLTPFLDLENGETRLELSLQRTKVRDTKQYTGNYALYLSVAERSGK